MSININKYNGRNDVGACFYSLFLYVNTSLNIESFEFEYYFYYALLLLAQEVHAIVLLLKSLLLLLLLFCR